MTRNNMVFSVLLSVLLLGGAAWKGLETSSTAAPPPKLDLAPLFAPAGLRVAGSRTLTDAKEFRLTGFIQPGCRDGALLVMPLKRNAEGARLMRHVVDEADFTPRYLLDGNLHDSFPGATFWMLRASHKVAALTGSDRPAPIVLAVGEIGSCQIASQIEWKTVSIALGTGLAASPLSPPEP